MKFFKKEEFDCPCCGKNECVEKLFLALESLRTFLSVPLVVNSGYRCKEHNEEVGGKPSSFHLQGMAADISIIGMDGKKRFEVLKYVTVMFNGIGIAKNYIHLDVRVGPQVMWVY